MESKNTTYIPRLDHLRFVAAALVFAYHVGSTYVPTDTYNPLLLIIKQGYIGVGLFMVVSGFILTTICLDKEIDYKSFIYNRFLRIYPLYIVCVFISVFSDGRKTDFADFLASATFMRNFSGATLIKFPHLWTVMVEFQFYLIFPFLMRFFSRNGYPYVLGIICIAMLIRGLIYLTDGTVQDSAYWTIIGRIDQFAIGMMVAAVFCKYRTLFSSPVWLVVAIAALVGWAYGFTQWCGGYYGPGSPNSTSPAWIVGPTLESIACGLVVLTYLSQRWLFPAVIDKALDYLGSISYSIYVWHFPIMVIIQKNWPDWLIGSIWWKATFVVFPIIIAVSSLTYYVIERPFFSMRTVYTKPALK